MKEYNFVEIEKKWQDIWAKEHYGSVTNVINNEKPKFYALIEFPYPSGDGLHVGHLRAFGGLEVVSRKRRLQGFDVLFPIGWDAFGLPTENFAIKTGKHPRNVTDKNIQNFIRQAKSLGFGFDWDRQVDTTDADYYKWTQWIFLQMFDKGLAYRDKTKVNFCPKCQVVLANEDCQGGECDICHTQIVQKEKDVWFLKITDYADRLLKGLETVDFTDRMKLEQRNWIGKSEGLELEFRITVDVEKNSTLKSNFSLGKFNVFTTRPDTIFGVTFCAIAPEHPIIEELKESIKNYDEILDYKKQSVLKTEFERLNSVSKDKSKSSTIKDKTGIKMDGIAAKNPITGDTVPVFVADYCIYGYGTGAVMGVPAHDQRDYDFAKKFSIDIKQVIDCGDEENGTFVSSAGILINSKSDKEQYGQKPLNLNGMSVKEAKEEVVKYVENCGKFLKEELEKNQKNIKIKNKKTDIKHGFGFKKTEYRMQDWAFNRQRYWGEPIPIVHCKKCGYVRLPDSDLPLTLPSMNDFAPSNDGESPLAKNKEWVNTNCPKCCGKAKRDVDTMPQWAGSSWYFLRYMSPNSKETLVDKEGYNKWGQVDWYNGGMEHVTRHLIYSRFWNMFLYDIGVVDNEEPYKKRTAQGLILGEDGVKMSKSRGNTVSPDVIVKEYGADAVRLFIMFVGDYEKAAPWNSKGINGCVRFLSRVWALQNMIKDCNSSDINIDMNEVINKVGDDIENLKFNTAIATLMELVNNMYKLGCNLQMYLDLLTMLYPFAPHIASELFEIKNKKLNKWVEQNYKNIHKKMIDLPIQINGKMKGTISVEVGQSQGNIKKAVFENARFFELLNGITIKKEIFVQDRIYNFII